VKNKTTQSKQFGFSLVEVLVTLFFIGVSLLLFAVVANAIVLNRDGRHREIALRIAEHQIQSLRTMPYADLPGSESFSNDLLPSLPQGAGTVNTTEISTGFTEAVVTVEWISSSSTIREVTLYTYIWHGGLGK
jgi:Tfp pilus assembly protein PilV